jgi:hypothetical protein
MPAGARIWGRAGGLRLPSTLPGMGLTFGLACVSALFFLWLRSESKGLVLSPHSRWWALAAAGLTGVISTVAAFAVVTAVGQENHVFPAFVSLGVATPSTLWLGEIRRGTLERRNPYRDALTLWLTWLLRRVDEGMAEDRETWCAARIVPAWTIDELIVAAHFYHEYLRERLSPAERQRYKISALVQAVEARLDIARLIEDNPRFTNGSAGRAKVSVALTSSRLAAERYRRALADLTRLAQMLRSDARQDLIRLLRVAYRSGLRRLPVYRPALRPEPPPNQRPHP